jgi:malate dehydrogenase (oxaloacetate-decarboxylating)(NADP+)
MAYIGVNLMTMDRMLTGVDLLHDPALNKGTAFTEQERDALGLRGLLPPRVFTQEQQVARVLQNLRRKPNNLEKYIFLIALQDRNETLFYRVLIDNMEELMPLVYTPTVGQACQEYGEIFRRSHGLFISANDRGWIKQLLRNWNHNDVRIIVVTDGERILGLGDLGAHGMGIPVGKLSLYTACAGVHPSACLPITIDVGTNNETLLNDPLYLGLRQRRLTGEAYDSLLEEFVTAVQDVFPNAVVQFEDFGNHNAFRLLNKYKNVIPTFDDDIQGTAGVTLAALLGALRISKQPLADQRILFLGAGEAGIGIADLIVTALVEQGLSEEEARKRCWFVDSKGLVVADRTDLVEHKRPYAHDYAKMTDFAAIVDALKPTALIGVSGQPAKFTPTILQHMAEYNERPIIFALSNPTSKSECTAAEAYTHTNGRAVFASGSPFNPVEYNGTTYVPGQANNSYVFPGVGLGAIACQSTRITDEMFYVAAKVLADLTGEEDLSIGRVLPSLKKVRELSVAIATAVAEVAYARGLASLPRPADLRAHVEAQVYKAEYQTYA